MDRPFQQIDVQVQGSNVFCVRLRHNKMDEDQLNQLSEELVDLVEQGGARKVALNLGPDDPIMLYSVFLAKLVSFQKRLRNKGGSLRLCTLGPETLEIFRICGLKDLFSFSPDQASAVAALA
jgi:anti-anti-sigma factor